MCRDKNGLTEEEFLKSYNPDKYPKPSLTADICIFAHSDVTEILLVKRGGHPYIGKWALPGGFANKNEPIEKTASRELKEETGYLANKITYLGQIAPSPGFCDEVVYLYKAHELKKGETNFDHDEFLNLNEYSLEEVKNMIIEGKITDAKTIACLFFYENIK